MRWAKSNLVPSLWIGNSIISTRCISCLMLSSFGWSALFWMPRCGSIQSCQLQTFVGFTMSEIEALYPPWTLSCFFSTCFTRTFWDLARQAQRDEAQAQNVPWTLKWETKMHRVGMLFMGVASNLDLDIWEGIFQRQETWSPLSSSNPYKYVNRPSKADETIYSLKLLDLLDMLWKTCWVCRVLEF